MAKAVRVTRAQVKAARSLLNEAESQGGTVPGALRKIAEAVPLVEGEETETPGLLVKDGVIFLNLDSLDGDTEVSGTEELNVSAHGGQIRYVKGPRFKPGAQVRVPGFRPGRPGSDYFAIVATDGRQFIVKGENLISLEFHPSADEDDPKSIKSADEEGSDNTIR